MKFRHTPDRTICASYCRYYKPYKNEEPKCAGYDAVMRLAQFIRDGIPSSLRNARGHEQRIISEVISRVCNNCPFCADDCDFMDSSGMLEPCGGFLVLAELLASKKIRPEDIE